MGRSGSRTLEYEDLFRKVLASMNEGRYRPIPTSEYSLISEVCAEAVDLRHQEEARHG
jgi:hypothetical protein